METSAALPTVLAPLVQCLDDALRRIGHSQIHGFQATVYGADCNPSKPPGIFSRQPTGFYDPPTINDDVEALVSLTRTCLPPATY